MSDELKYIDNLFKESLSDQPVASTPANIKGATKLIGKFNFLSFSFNTFNIYYTSLIVLLISFAVLFFSLDNSQAKEYKKSIEFGRNLSQYRTVVLPIDTLDNEPKEFVQESNIQKTKTFDTDYEEPVITKTIPIDTDTVSEDDAINSQLDTMVIYKRIIIADTVRTIMYQKIRPKKKKKKD